MLYIFELNLIFYPKFDINAYRYNFNITFNFKELIFKTIKIKEKNKRFTD